MNTELPIQTRIDRLIQALSQQLFEKSKLIRLALLSSLAGESIFLLGPPGVAKSMVARKLKYAFEGARAFEYLMGKFSTPDEVFGPVSISKLKNEDKYERLTEHYLPGANIIFLDEIWKASPPIQNALLTVLNEKVFRNGEQEVPVDIRGLIAASNELPLRGEGLEALWDRFLVRIRVTGIEDEMAFNQMVLLPRRSGYQDTVSTDLKVTEAEYLRWSDQMDEVAVPPHVLGVISNIRQRIEDRNEQVEASDYLYVSDRRWRKVVRLMRASAFLNGRAEVDVMDCFLIAECIWDRDQQIEEVHELVQSAILAFGYRNLLNIPALMEELERIQEEIKAKTTVVEHKQVKEIQVFKDAGGNAFCKLNKFWGNDPAYIRMSDYERLSGEEAFIPIFEKAGKQFRPFQTYAVTMKSPHVLRSKSKELTVEVAEVEREVKHRKPASAQMKQVWEGEIRQLLSICDESLDELARRQAIDRSHLHNNLFVEKSLATLVTQSLEQAKSEIINIRLEIEKTRHSYENLEAAGAPAE